jgi:L-alanine-DL-glutamate epimerase-like enolase superfamily enzyme
MGTPEIIKRKVMAADGFSILKVKLGGGNDKEIIEAIRSVSSLPLCVDVNQGWKNVQEAKEMIDWLSDKNVLFVEQPLPKTEIEGQKYLFQHSALPVIADEFVQIPEDVQKVRGLFHGINIKLMKCGGLAPALKMAALAKEMGLLLLIGSMTETSCGIRAAAQLSVLANWVDLDGPLLTKNNPFPPVTYRSGVLLP